MTDQERFFAADGEEMPQWIRLWLDGIEAKHGVGPDDCTRICEQTGEPFVDISWCQITKRHIHTDGNPYFTFNTATDAWIWWKRAMQLYLKDRPGKLYWRCKPELHTLCPRIESLHGAEQSLDYHVIEHRYFVISRLYAETDHGGSA